MELRIKALRKALGLTQQEFADKIGSVQNTITGYETGRRTPSNQVIALICEKFNVNEKWLRTGEGEMFVQHSRDEEIARFFGEVLKDERDDFRRRLIHALSKLTADEWAMIERRARELLAEDDEAQKKTGPYGPVEGSGAKKSSRAKTPKSGEVPVRERPLKFY